METVNLKTLQQSLGTHYGNSQEWEFELLKHRRISKNDRLSVYRAKNISSGKTVAVKVQSERRTKGQFAALDAMVKAGVDCVKPIYLDEHNRFFVMDWVDAPLIGNQLGRSDHHALIEKSGRWLSVLQQNTGKKEIWPAKPHKIRARTVRQNVVAKQVSSMLTKKMKRIDMFPTGFVRLHGDFHIFNIFLEQNKVIGFDAQYDRFGSPFQDPARFLLSLAERRQSAEGAEENWIGDTETDRKAFFEGYGALEQEHVWIFDFIEDFMYFARWCRLQLHSKNSAESRVLYHELQVRGLVGEEMSLSRPGRLVKGSEGRPPFWSCDVQPEPRNARKSGLLAGLWQYCKSRL